jgi:hypothetical protein
MTDKILKNEIEMTIWALISFLMMRVDDYRDLSMKIKMMNRCRNFLMMIEEVSIEMKKFLEFLKFLIETKMKMKMIVSENFLLWTIREINVSLMIVKMSVFSLIDLEMIILEIRMILEVIVEMMLFVILIVMRLIINNRENFVQISSREDDEWRQNRMI